MTYILYDVTVMFYMMMFVMMRMVGVFVVYMVMPVVYSSVLMCVVSGHRLYMTYDEETKSQYL